MANGSNNGKKDQANLNTENGKIQKRNSHDKKKNKV
jgi:hypothetical protein